MGLRLRTERKEEWITLTADGEEVQFLVCPLSPEEVNKGLKQATVAEWDRGQRFESFDPYVYKTWKVKKVIRDWKGIENADGSELLCTAKTKEQVYNVFPDLIDKVLDKADELAETVKVEQEDAEKN